MNLRITLVRTLVFTSLALGAHAQSSFPSPEQWASNGQKIWDSIASGRLTTVTDTAGAARPVRIVGYADLQVSAAPANLEIDCQYPEDFRNADGKVIKTDMRGPKDPITNLGIAQSGGTFLGLPLPFDHGTDGKPLGLRVSDPKSSIERGGAYNRLGIRFNNTPAGRLLFLYEMSTPAEDGARWYAREFTAPLPGCPWRPSRAIINRPNPEVHLRKLAVVQLEPWADPAARIPAKLQRGDLKIDFDAAAQKMSWDALKAWIAQNVGDAMIPAGKTFVIQLPEGHVVDSESLGIFANKWTKWGKAVHALTGGRKVWLVGHPSTTIVSYRSNCDNLGLLFCRIARPVNTPAEGKNAIDAYKSGAELAGANIDFRNNLIDCPDNITFAGIVFTRAENAVVTDNIISGTGAGVGTSGTSVLKNCVIARNWMERGFDGFQMYGAWVDSIVAYNHIAGASGFANRSGEDGHLGANLHSDEFQSQSNGTDVSPQTIHVFSNFSQFGRHNWPAAWAEIGGATQNFIIDGDSYAYSNIYWNIFQNLMPAGHRGLKTISPDRDWVTATPKASQKDYIENLAVMGNAFLERWDHNNNTAYGYFAEGTGIGGSLTQPFFEMVNSENAYVQTHLIRQVALFKQTIESRPDPVARSDWRSGAPTLTDVYQKPITFTGSWETGYTADFSRTAHAGDKFLEGFVEPSDYAPKSGWDRSPGGAVKLTPASELSKIAPMPVSYAESLGDPARKGGLFDELKSTPVQARPLTLETPWRAGSADDGFLLHLKFGSVGTGGTVRELVSEAQGDKRYEVVLTENDTVRYRLYQGGKIISEVESTDRFKSGDHLTMQVYTPYFPVVAETHYPSLQLKLRYKRGIREIRYISGPTPPAAADLKISPAVLNVWMNPADRFRFSEYADGAWRPVLGGMDSVHACAIRTFSDNRNDSFHRKVASIKNGTAANYWRDMFPIAPGEWHSLYLDGPGEDSTDKWKPSDIRWFFTKTEGYPVVTFNRDGKVTGANGVFGGMSLASGAVRGVIRHNIDHQDKQPDWKWTPDVDLPRGQVTLFRTFDGSYESFRMIRGGQGEYGPPPNAPFFRSMETVGPALAFIREPIDATGKVDGWGTPDIYLTKDRR